MTFVQSKGGIPVDGETAQAIRVRATEIFYTIATHREDIVAPSWSLVDSNCKDFYRAKICQFWPDLRMCAFNWKADAVAGIVYSTWYRRFSRKRRLSEHEEGQVCHCKRQRQQGPRSGPEQAALSPSPPLLHSLNPLPLHRNHHNRHSCHHHLHPFRPDRWSHLPHSHPADSPPPTPATNSPDLLESSPSQHIIPVRPSHCWLSTLLTITYTVCRQPFVRLRPHWFPSR